LLTARYQRTNDLLINLFKAYGSVSDEVFRAWLICKQDDHDEGNELTPDELMMVAKNKYDAMVEKGAWNAPSVEEKIVALEAKFNLVAKNLTRRLAAKGESKSAKLVKKQMDKGRATTQSTGSRPSPPTRRKSPTKSAHGTGEERTPVANVRSGEPTSQRNASGKRIRRAPRTRKGRAPQQQRKQRRSLRLLARVSRSWSGSEQLRQTRTRTTLVANDGEGGPSS
jgi:hypothetical protein